MRFFILLIIAFNFSFALAGNPDELPSDSIYRIQSRWTNQKGEVISFSDLAGKPRILAMIYTKCEAACPLLVQNIKNYLKSKTNKEAADLSVDLFSFDSARESTETLQKFMTKYKIESPKWTLYYASKTQVAEVAAALEIQYKGLASGEFIHSDKFFVINAKGQP